MLVLAAAALWGTTGTAQAFGAVDDPVAVGAARLAVGGGTLALIAGACYGLYTSSAKALLDRQVPVVVAMGVTLGSGAGLLGPVLVAGGLRLVGVRPLLMVGWLGLVTTAAAYLLFARGLRQLPAGTVGTLSLAEPLTAAVLGLLVLGERPAPPAALGALSLLAGLLLAALRPVRTDPPPIDDEEGAA